MRRSAVVAIVSVAVGAVVAHNAAGGAFSRWVTKDRRALHTGQKLAVTLLEYEQSGAPVRLADLMSPRCDPEEGGAPPIEAAMAELWRVWSDQRESDGAAKHAAFQAGVITDAPDRRARAWDEWRATSGTKRITELLERYGSELGEVAERHRPVLAMLDEVLDRPHCAAAAPRPHELEYWPSFTPTTHPVLDLAALLSYRSLERARTGDAEAAAQDCARLLQLAQCQGAVPVISAHLLRLEVDARAARTAEAMLALAPPAPDTLQMLSDRFIAEAEALDLYRIVQGERVRLYQWIQHREVWPKLLQGQTEGLALDADTALGAFAEMEAFANALQQGEVAAHAAASSLSPELRQGPLSPPGAIVCQNGAWTQYYMLPNLAYALDATATTRALLDAAAERCDVAKRRPVNDSGEHEGRKLDRDPNVKDDIAFRIPMSGPGGALP